MTKMPMKSVVLVAAALLAGCGGGGGGDQADALDTAQLRGRWVTAAGAAPAYTAVVLPGASNTASAWLLAQDASRLVKLTVRGDASAQGKAYALGQASSQAVTGQVTASLAAAPKTFSVTGVAAGSLALSQSDALSTPAVQADAAGGWSATAGGQAQALQWTVGAAGAVAGVSTTGCSYTGQLTAMAGASVYGAQFDESCPDGARITYSGIATLNATKSGLTVVVTSADESRGAAVFFSK